MTPSDQVTEIVLPSGAFARIRRATYRDWIEAMSANANMCGVELASRLVTVDGRKVTAEEILDMEMPDGMAVVGLVNVLVQKGVTTMKGIA